MKTLSLLTLLFVTSSAHAQSGPSNHFAIIAGAICNNQHGIGEVDFAIYNEKHKTFQRKKMNVVNEELCKKGEYTASSLVSFAGDSIGYGQIFLFEINANSIVTDVQRADLDDKKTKQIKSRFSMYGVNEPIQQDDRILEVEMLGLDPVKDTVAIQELLEKAKN